MKNILLLVAVLLFSGACDSSAVGKQSGDIQANAKNLNKASVNYFGVDILSLAVLLDSKPGNFYLKDSMSSDRLERVNNLAKVGLVQVSENTAKDGVYLQIVPTKKGDDIKSALTH